MYKNNAGVLLSRILTILSSDWLHHARTVRGVYELIWTNSWIGVVLDLGCLITIFQILKAGQYPVQVVTYAQVGKWSNKSTHHLLIAMSISFNLRYILIS